MSSVQTLQDVLKDELKDLYNAENQILKALPKVIEASTSATLKEALSMHLQETTGQVKRLKKIGKILGMKMTGKTCKAMKGLIAEGKEAIETTSEDGSLIDVLIVGACQRIEHYEIAAYGTTRAIAETLGLQDIAKLLQETLNEEGQADKKLTNICEGEIFIQANSNSPQVEDADESDDSEDDEDDSDDDRYQSSSSPR